MRSIPPSYIVRWLAGLAIALCAVVAAVLLDGLFGEPDGDHGPTAGTPEVAGVSDRETPGRVPVAPGVARTLIVDVVDAGGRPVTRANVWLDRWLGDVEAAGSTIGRTSEDGRWRHVVHGEATKLRIRAGIPGCWPAEKWVEVGDRWPVSVSIACDTGLAVEAVHEGADSFDPGSDELRVVVCIVHPEKDKERIAGRTLLFNPRRRWISDVFRDSDGVEKLVDWSCSVDEDGVREWIVLRGGIEEGGRWICRGVPREGRVWVVAWAGDGSRGWGEAVPVDGDGSAPGRTARPGVRAGTRSIRMTYRDGRPCSSRSVQIRPDWMAPCVEVDWNPVPTDPDGHAIVPVAPGGADWNLLLEMENVPDEAEVRYLGIGGVMRSGEDGVELLDADEVPHRMATKPVQRDHR